MSRTDYKVLHCLNFHPFPARNAFDTVKKTCKEALDHQKAVLANASDELVDRYKALEAVCRPLSRECLITNAAFTQEGVFADKSADELTQELENEKNNLDLNSGANPGVVEQYERRKREVCTHPPRWSLRLTSFQIEALTATITGREKNAERTERAIKNARVRYSLSGSFMTLMIG